jgi:hypothetical protein
MAKSSLYALLKGRFSPRLAEFEKYRDLIPLEQRAAVDYQVALTAFKYAWKSILTTTLVCFALFCVLDPQGYLFYCTWVGLVLLYHLGPLLFKVRKLKQLAHIANHS